MLAKLFFGITSIALLFVNIKEFAIPYMAIFSGLIVYFFYQKKFNEIVIAITFFGFSFFSLYSQIIGASSILLILVSLAIVLLYRFFTNWEGNKFPLKFNSFFIALFLFTAFVLLSFNKTIFIIEYQDFKIQLFLLWTAIFIVTVNCLDKNIVKFDFEVFLMLSYFLFVPHFSIIADEGEVLSPLANWDKYSILADGIRGSKGVDVISAGRYSGMFILVFIIYFIDFEKQKLLLLPLIAPAFILLIIVQTRQAFVALMLPIIAIIIYYLFILKSNVRNKTFVNLLSVGILFSGVYWYVDYVNNKNVETRVLASKEDSGREKVWNDAKTLIVNDETDLGFGNFIFYGKAYSWPHNIFFETVIEVGWLALILLVILSLYLLYEIPFLFLNKISLTKIEVFLIFIALYYFILAQFSADIPRNLFFFFAISSYFLLKENRINSNLNET